MLGWGESVVDRISCDLREAFPNATGFSPRNLRSLKQFYLAYSDPAIWLQPVAKLTAKSKSGAEIRRQAIATTQRSNDAAPAEIWLQPVAKLTEATAIEFLQQLVAGIPWGQNLLILNKLSDPAARLWYLQAVARFGWTRPVLLNQIKAGAFERAATEKKSHNFGLALPEHLAEQAEEMLKSSYSLEFLGIRRAISERRLEDRRIDRLRDFILELGYGFCFICRHEA